MPFARLSVIAFRDHCATLFGFYRAQGVVRPEGTLMSADELSRALLRPAWPIA